MTQRLDVILQRRLVATTNGGHPVVAATNDDSPADVGGQGTMVIRAWTEQGHESPLRIRMTHAEDCTAEPTTLVAADTEQAVSAVRNWLTRLAEAG